MKISEVITELETSEAKGFQLAKISGLIHSTWLIYKKGGFFYFFDINQKVEFIDRYRYTQKELFEEFKSGKFRIELSIS